MSSTNHGWSHDPDGSHDWGFPLARPIGCPLHLMVSSNYVTIIQVDLECPLYSTLFGYVSLHSSGSDLIRDFRAAHKAFASLLTVSAKSLTNSFAYGRV